MCVSASAVDLEVILALMAEVDWEVKEVMGQHSRYVDLLLKVCQSQCCRMLQNMLAVVPTLQRK
jgi:hypothetical protein